MPHPTRGAFTHTAPLPAQPEGTLLEPGVRGSPARAPETPSCSLCAPRTCLGGWLSAQRPWCVWVGSAQPEGRLCFGFLKAVALLGGPAHQDWPPEEAALRKAAGQI